MLSSEPVVEHLLWTILPWTIDSSAMKMEWNKLLIRKFIITIDVSILWLSICDKSAHCEGCNENTPYQNYSHTPTLLLSNSYNGSQWYGRIESFKIILKLCIHEVWSNVCKWPYKKVCAHINWLQMLIADENCVRDCV